MIEHPVILITGTRKGIGRHLALHFLEPRRHASSGAAARPADLEADGYRHHCLDVSDEAAVRRLLAEVRRTAGRAARPDQQRRASRP